MTILRYYIIVAAVYFVSFLAIGLFAGEPELRSAELSTRIFLPSFLGIAMGVFVTWVAMTRFPGLGGSIYVAPTVMHAALFFVICVSMYSH